MSVTVEDLQIKISADISDALSKIPNLITQLNNLKHITETLQKTAIPNIQSQLAPVKQILDQYGNAFVSDSTKTQDAVKKTGQATQQAAETAKKALQSLEAEHKKINDLVQQQYDAEKKAKSLEAVQAQAALPTSVARVPSSLASDILSGTKEQPIVDNAPMVNESKLSGWQKFMSQYYTALDSVKAKLNQTGLYGNENSIFGGSAWNKVQQGISKVKTSMNGATEATQKYGNQVKETTSKSGSMFGSLGSIINRALIYTLLYGGIRKIGDLIKTGIQSAIDAPEIENLFRVAFGAASNQAADFAKKLKDNLGIDEYAAKQMLGTFQELSSSMGIGMNTSTKMSESLTMLANDIASLYNVDADQAAENLESALTGQWRAVRKYGYTLSEATIQQTAYKYGLAATGQELTEQQKVIARYLTLIDQSKNAQGDMGRTLGSVQNQLRVLKQNLTAAGRSIGSAFIPFIQAALPWLNALAIVVQRVGVALSRATYSMFGLNYDNEMKKQQAVITGITGAGKASTKAANDATDANEKLQRSVLGFDRLNRLDDPSKSKSSSSGDGSGDGLDFNVPTLDVPSTTNQAEQLADKIQAIFEKIKSYIPQATIDNFRIASDKLKDSWNDLYNTIKGKDIFEKFAGNFLGEVIDGLTNLKLQISATLEVLDGLIEKDPAKVFNGFKDALTALIGTNVEPFYHSIDLLFGTHLNENWQKTKKALMQIDFKYLFSSLQMKGLGDNVSTETVLALKSFYSMYTGADKILKELSWSGKAVTKDMADGINKNIQGMADQTIAGFQRQRDESIKNIQGLATLSGGLSKQETDQILKNINSGYDQRIKSEQTGQDRIKTIMDNASKQKRALTKSESDEISKIESNMLDSGVKALSKNQVEEQAILENMRVNHTQLSAQEAASIVKDSKTTTDKVIADANTKYNDTVAAIIRERDETHTISADQADKLIKAAKKQRDDSVTAAEDQHQKVVAAAKKQSGECVNQVDWQSGQVKSKWNVMWDNIKTAAQTKWNEIKNFFTQDVPKWWNTNVAPWFTVTKWQGLFNQVKTAAQTKWNEIVTWWNNSAIVKWWNSYVSPWFTAKKWQDMMDGVKTAFKNIFKDAVNGAIDKINSFIKWLNDRLHISWGTINIAGKEVIKGGSTQLVTIQPIPRLATGAVLRRSTLVNVAEYAGAQTNPEIVTPQRTMYDTVVAANGELVSAISSLVYQVIDTIKEYGGNGDMTLDGDVVTRAVISRINGTTRRTGKCPIV